MLNRRHFFAQSAIYSSVFTAAGQANRRPRILLRSSWQSVNIGDIGHTPGALSLIGKHFPDAEITLWPGVLGHGSRELLTGRYPQLRIAEGKWRQ